MSLTITKSPTTTLSDGFISKHSSIGNPIYYDIQRKDTLIAGVGSSSGNVAFNVGTGTQIYTPGDTVYVYASDGGVELIKGQYTVLTAATILGSNWISINRTTFSGYLGIDGGFVNQLGRRNHRVEVQLTINSETTSTLSFSTDLRGLARVYVNGLIQSYIARTLSITYAQVQELLTDFDIAFALRYRELWLGYSEDLFKTDANTYYACKAVQQLGTNNRMTLYETYYLNASAYSQSEFLTAFEKPKYWEGMPFTVCALITDLTAPVDKNIKSYNAGTTATAQLTLVGKGVYALQFNPVAGSLKSELWLSTNEEIGSEVNSYVENYVIDYLTT